MNSYIIISLLLLIIIDATGDALRFLNRSIASHTMESLQIAGWFAIWALFGFEWLYIPVYILGRIWLFDVLFNVLTAHDPLYMGKNDLFGLAVHKFSEWVRQDYKHFSFTIKFVSLIAWIGLLIKI